MAKAYPFKGVLCDITGVLYEGGSSVPIPGSVEALERLKAGGVQVRLLTNESSQSTAQLIANLGHLGFTVTPNEVFSPIPSCVKMLEKRSMVPHLLVNPDVEAEFAHLTTTTTPTPPTCVVVGDADHAFNYDNMNKAFRALKAMERPFIVSLGGGKYYKHHGHLQLDVAPFVAALVCATPQTEVTVCGKPSRDFFLPAVESMDLLPGEVLMVGDDIENDVGAAQTLGIKGALVRTGKFTPDWEKHPKITPDFIGDNLAAVVDDIGRE